MDLHKQNEEMKKLLKEIRDSHIADPKHRTSQELEWCKRVDRLLGACGIFSIDFDGCVRVSPRADGIVRVEMDFETETEAELAIEQIAGLLRGMDKLKEVMESEDGFETDIGETLNIICKMQDLRYGEVSV